MKKYKVLFRSNNDMDIIMGENQSSSYDKEFDDLREALNYAYKYFHHYYLEENMDLYGWDEVVAKETKTIFSKGYAEFGDFEVKVEQLHYLTSDQDIVELRKQISLGSIYYSDYKNQFGVDEHTVCDLFEGYESYLSNLSEEGLNVEDNRDNLLSWFQEIDPEALPYYGNVDLESLSEMAA